MGGAPAVVAACAATLGAANRSSRSTVRARDVPEDANDQQQNSESAANDAVSATASMSDYQLYANSPAGSGMPITSNFSEKRGRTPVGRR